MVAHYLVLSEEDLHAGMGLYKAWLDDQIAAATAQVKVGSHLGNTLQNITPGITPYHFFYFSSSIEVKILTIHQLMSYFLLHGSPWFS